MSHMRKNSVTWFSVMFALVSMTSSQSFAWIDTGHKIVAMIAWEDLTPKAKTTITELLKQHPRYEKDLLTGLPNGASAEETARHAFLVASTWPDLVRSQSHPMRAAYNHAPWH